MKWPFARLKGEQGFESRWTWRRVGEYVTVLDVQIRNNGFSGSASTDLLGDALEVFVVELQELIEGHRRKVDLRSPLGGITMSLESQTLGNIAIQFAVGHDWTSELTGWATCDNGHVRDFILEVRELGI